MLSPPPLLAAHRLISGIHMAHGDDDDDDDNGDDFNDI